MELRVGVVGYSNTPFDKAEAERLLNHAFEEVLRDHPDAHEVWVISGLTDVGVPGIAYRVAKENGWKTSGISCARSYKYQWFPGLDEVRIVGMEWGGRESEEFLRRCGVLIRIGGGQQSNDEADEFRKRGGKAYEYELPSP